MRRQGRQGRSVTQLVLATCAAVAIAPLGGAAAAATTQPGPVTAVLPSAPSGAPSAVIVRAPTTGAARAAVA
ncbi:MAG: hypothetical protein NVSMB16_16050 [Acidimicrobiales bacterium]